MNAGAGAILLVEDDIPLREQIRDLLESDYYEVVEVSDGWEALNYLRTTRADCGLVIMDISLPIMSGWELLARIRSEEILKETPVIIVSARPIADAVGTPPAFRKPLPPDDFLDAVRQYRR